MAIGSAVTNKFHIGSAEVRIGALAEANQLTPAHSVGLLQSAVVNFNQESVDLEGGLPKTLIDTVITKTNVTVTAQAYEYSRKNIRVMVNEGTEAAGSVTAYESTLTAQATPASNSLTFTTMTVTPQIGDMVVCYPAGEPEKISILRVTGGTTGSVSFDPTKTPLLFTLPIGSVVYKANQIGLGNTTKTNYFSLDVVGLEHSTERPTGFKFWKCAISGGMEYSYSNDNFAVTPLTFKVLQPSAADYSAGGNLAHLADVIPGHPLGMQWAG